MFPVQLRWFNRHGPELFLEWQATTISGRFRDPLKQLQCQTARPRRFVRTGTRLRNELVTYGQLVCGAEQFESADNSVDGLRLTFGHLRLHRDEKLDSTCFALRCGTLSSRSMPFIAMEWTAVEPADSIQIISIFIGETTIIQSATDMAQKRI